LSRHRLPRAALVTIVALVVLSAATAAVIGFEVPRRITDRVYTYLESRKMETAPLVFVRVGTWLNLQPGLDLRELEFKRKNRWFSKFSLEVLRVDPQQLALRMVVVSPDDLPGADIDSLAARTGAIALLNTNYFEPDFKVMGLVIADGKPIYPLRKEGNIHHGVWFLKGREAFLLNRANFSPDGVDQAFQAGPWLVTDGEAETRFRNAQIVARRSAVAVDRKGRVLLIATDALLGGLALPELAWLLAYPEEKGGVGAWRAINCDGGTSTQMILRHPRAAIRIRSTLHVPIFLGVFPR